MRDAITTRDLANLDGHVVHATFTALGELLTRDERAALARYLEPSLQTSLLCSTHTRSFESEELYARAGGREQAQMIIEVIGRKAPPEVVHLVERALPADLAALLHERELRGPEEPAVRVRAQHPSPQAHSVVREDNPHGDRKLSSGHVTARLPR